MSMVINFKKQGGFYKLLSLIESCEPEKQQQLISLVRIEDPAWATLLKQKLITLDKFISWPNSIVEIVLSELNNKAIATILVNCQELQKAKLLLFIPKHKKTEVLDLVGEIKKGSGELHAAMMLLIQTIRELDKNKMISIPSHDQNNTQEKKSA